MSKPRIFLSYAREDGESVKRLYQALTDAGFEPWMDVEKLFPGEQWEPAIERAIRESDFFVACISARSINRRGMIQKELKKALDIWQEQLDYDIYMIPARLEDCQVPPALARFQWGDLFREDGFARLQRALEEGTRRRGNNPPPKLPSPPIFAPSPQAVASKLPSLPNWLVPTGAVVVGIVLLCFLTALGVNNFVNSPTLTQVSAFAPSAAITPTILALPMLTPVPTQTPVTEYVVQTNKDGMFMIKYPRGWMVNDQEATLATVSFTAPDRSAQGTVKFGAAGNQTAEQALNAYITDMLKARSPDARVIAQRKNLDGSAEADVEFTSADLRARARTRARIHSARRILFCDDVQRARRSIQSVYGKNIRGRFKHL